MSNTKHTPGPWEKYNDCIINPTTGGNICVLSGGLSRSGTVTFENYEANAKLIAAAPELYSIVRKIADLELADPIKSEIQKVITKIQS